MLARVPSRSATTAPSLPQATSTSSTYTSRSIPTAPSGRWTKWATSFGCPSPRERPHRQQRSQPDSATPPASRRGIRPRRPGPDVSRQRYRHEQLRRPVRRAQGHLDAHDLVAASVAITYADTNQSHDLTL